MPTMELFVVKHVVLAMRALFCVMFFWCFWFGKALLRCSFRPFRLLNARLCLLKVCRESVSVAKDGRTVMIYNK